MNIIERGRVFLQSLRALAGSSAVGRGRCPVCGRWVDLTLQRDGAVDRCACGVEAVLIVEERRMQRWYWRDPIARPAAGPSGRPMEDGRWKKEDIRFRVAGCASCGWPKVAGSTLNL